MKTLNKTLFALVTGTMMSMGANAALYTTTDTNYVGQPYVGIKAGQFDIDTNTNNVDTDAATAYGVYGGYNFTPNFGAEVEYMTSSEADIELNGAKAGEYDAQTLGAYGTYRYNFPDSAVYAKGKLGFAQTKVEVADDSYDETGIAGGLGLGYNVSPNMAIEAEYAMLPTVEGDNINDIDANLWTIGAHMKF